MYIVMLTKDNAIKRFRIHNAQNGKEYVFIIAPDKIEMVLPETSSYVGEQAIDFLDALIDAITGNGGFASLESTTLLKRAMKESREMLKENK